MTTHPFDQLPDRGKEPTTRRSLDKWIQNAQHQTGIAAGRLGWLVASSVVTAALQRVVDVDGLPRLLLKGGAYLEVRLGLQARATKDLDGLFRGDFSDFMGVLDRSLRDAWGVIELQRTEVVRIERVERLIKPVRFKVKLLVNGQTWRSVDVEVAADEGQAGLRVDRFASPSLAHFGLPTPIELAGIVFDYQVAQKLHACTDPHEPPNRVNDRARDLVDLLLIKEHCYDGKGDIASLRTACLDVFEARAQDASTLGLLGRVWPPVVRAYDHWRTDYATAAYGHVDLSLEEAVALMNKWIGIIDVSST